MPLFHFNARSGSVVLPDLEGEDLPNIEAAREVAIVSARETLLEAIKTHNIPPDCIEVTDGDGIEVVTVLLSDFLKS